MSRAVDVVPGMVFYLDFHRLYGQGGTAYPKYAIVGRTDPELLMLLICTEVPSLARKNEKMARSYVKIDVASHKFLKYDSWVDCNDAKDEYSIAALADVLKRKPECHVGALTPEKLRQVIGGVAVSPKLEHKKRDSILQALSRVESSYKTKV